MNITEYITHNGGYISSAEAKKVSLYNQLLYGTRTGRIVRVRRGVYALNNGLAKQMIDVETLVPGGVLCLYKESDIMKILDDAYKRCREEQRWV